MTLGQSNHEAAQAKLTPDFMKSDADKTKENLEGGLRNVTGAGHGHDAGRVGSGGIADGLKPANERTLGEKANHKLDQAGSVVQPNKSTAQEAHDYVTPGNHSAGATGVLASAGEAIGNAATGIKNTVVGGGSNEHH